MMWPVLSTRNRPASRARSRLLDAPHDVGHAPALQGGIHSAWPGLLDLASSEIVLMIISVSLSLCTAGCVRSTCRALAMSTYAACVLFRCRNETDLVSLVSRQN